MPPCELIAFLVDDDGAVRESLSLLIESEGYPVRAFARAEEFLASCGPGACGCAIVDLRMPGLDGICLQEEMMRRGIQIPIIFLTGHGDVPTSVKAMKAGAFDFLTKPIDGGELLHIIDAAMAEDRVRCTETERHLMAASRLSALTAREFDVFKLAARGLANKEIAQRLGVSFRTVEIHRSRVMHKTGATTLIQLANIAREIGIAV